MSSDDANSPAFAEFLPEPALPTNAMVFTSVVVTPLMASWIEILTIWSII